MPITRKKTTGGRDGRKGGHKGLTGRTLIVCVVDSHDEHGRAILRRGRDDHLLGASLQVAPALLSGGEDARGLAHIVSTCLPPPDLCGVLGLVHLLDGK